MHHDAGALTITTAASSEAEARRIVMQAERCPERSIVSVRMVRSLYPQLAELNEEERTALLAFAAEHGRCWKSKLLLGWEHAAYPGPLQAIRNNFGPGWLRRLRLPKPGQ